MGYLCDNGLLTVDKEDILQYSWKCHSEDCARQCEVLLICGFCEFMDVTHCVTSKIKCQNGFGMIWHTWIIETTHKSEWHDPTGMCLS